MNNPDKEALRKAIHLHEQLMDLSSERGSCPLLFAMRELLDLEQNSLALQVSIEDYRRQKNQNLERKLLRAQKQTR